MVYLFIILLQFTRPFKDLCVEVKSSQRLINAKNGVENGNIGAITFGEL